MFSPLKKDRNLCAEKYFEFITCTSVMCGGRNSINETKQNMEQKENKWSVWGT
jgi:hypothetical protein